MLTENNFMVSEHSIQTNYKNVGQCPTHSMISFVQRGKHAKWDYILYKTTYIYSKNVKK